MPACAYTHAGWGCMHPVRGCHSCFSATWSGKVLKAASAHVKALLALTASALLGHARGACLSITADTPATNFHYQAVMQSLGSRCQASQVKCAFHPSAGSLQLRCIMLCRLPSTAMHYDFAAFLASPSGSAVFLKCCNFEKPSTPGTVQAYSEQGSCPGSHTSTTVQGQYSCMCS